MSKVLITGATGFIGNHVTRLCLEKGDEVRVMVMPGEDRSPLQGMDVEFVEGNAPVKALGEAARREGAARVAHGRAFERREHIRQPHARHFLARHVTLRVTQTSFKHGRIRLVFFTQTYLIGFNDLIVVVY